MFERYSLQYTSAIFGDDSQMPDDQFELMVVHKAEAAVILNRKMKLRRERMGQALAFELRTGEVPGGDDA